MAQPDRFHDALLDLTTDLLDAWYDAHPSSNAFGADYDGPGSTPSGTYFIGRDGGPDGDGVDYIMRRFRDPENPREDEREYVYGKYGWMDENDLVDELALLRQVFVEAVDRDLLDVDVLERFDEAGDALEAGLQEEREQYNLGDLADLFRDHDIDTLRTLLAHGDEEGRVVWCLCFSKDEEDNVVENVVETPVVSERDRFMLVRTERYYHDEQTGETKRYAYAAVVGYDDTPERFFVHRLESDPDIRDPETEWTPAMVREKMGFDLGPQDVADGTIPQGERVRIQGDLVVVRHDYAVEREAERARWLEQAKDRILRDYGCEYSGFTDVDGVRVGDMTGRVRVKADDTDALRDLQDEVGLEEETVRAEQDERGWDRLTAGRRQEIVEDLLRERVYQWACDQHDADPAAIKADAHEAADEEFSSTAQQANSAVGNHVLIVSDAVEYEAPRAIDEDAQAAVVVPEESTLMAIHDEHEDKMLSLGQGVYTFRFLDGFETERWQQ